MDITAVEMSAPTEDARETLKKLHVPESKITTILLSIDEANLGEHATSKAVFECMAANKCDLIVVPSVRESGGGGGNPLDDSYLPVVEGAVFTVDLLAKEIIENSPIPVLVTRPLEDVQTQTKVNVPFKNIVVLLPGGAGEHEPALQQQDEENDSSMTATAASFVAVRGVGEAHVHIINVVYGGDNDVMDQEAIEDAVEESELVLDKCKQTFMRRIRQIALALPRDDPDYKFGLDLKTKSLPLDVEYQREGLTNETLVKTVVKYAKSKDVSADVLLIERCNTWEIVKLLQNEVVDYAIALLSAYVIVFPVREAAAAAAATAASGSGGGKNNDHAIEEFEREARQIHELSQGLFRLVSCAPPPMASPSSSSSSSLYLEYRCEKTLPTIADTSDRNDREDDGMFDHDDQTVTRTEAGRSLSMVYHVVFSNVYRVPALYFYGTDSSSGSFATLADISLGMAEKLPIEFCSSGEHPVTGAPCFYIHPCNTAMLLQNFDTSKNYVVTWLSVISNIVGVNVSILSSAVV